MRVLILAVFDAAGTQLNLLIYVTIEYQPLDVTPLEVVTTRASEWASCNWSSTSLCNVDATTTWRPHIHPPSSVVSSSRWSQYDWSSVLGKCESQPFFTSSRTLEITISHRVYIRTCATPITPVAPNAAICSMWTRWPSPSMSEPTTCGNRDRATGWLLY